eukprot:00416.XXX_258_440_1 [CDS] Oithona nana genome sequencing.
MDNSSFVLKVYPSNVVYTSPGTLMERCFFVSSIFCSKKSASLVSTALTNPSMELFSLKHC